MKKMRSSRTVAILTLSLVLVLAMGATAMAKGKGGGNGNGSASVTAGPLASVQIKVVSLSTGQPLEGARVQLYNDATGYSVTNTAGADGVATFNDVPYFDTYYRAYLVNHGFAPSVRLLTVDEPFEFSTQAMLQ